jgi:hypothetical protein
VSEAHQNRSAQVASRTPLQTREYPMLSMYSDYDAKEGVEHGEAVRSALKAATQEWGLLVACETFRIYWRLTDCFLYWLAPMFCRT